tara:strand:+ start:302 stop:784 length:483 start_codon:yes stop_codon:yes gene_type:complete
MKKIFFLRHAKSSWSDFSLKDFDRPLSTRGIQDAELMGNYFKTKDIELDVIISSPSKRTKETLDHFFSNNFSKIEYVKSLYHAHLEDILEVVTGSLEDTRTIMIVGHNPSMHEVTEFLSGDFLPKYPTCGLASLLYEGEWQDLKASSCELDFFKMPRELR